MHVTAAHWYCAERTNMLEYEQRRKQGRVLLGKAYKISENARFFGTNVNLSGMPGRQ